MHQADVPLLNEISQFDAIIPIFMGNLHHESQIGNDQFFGSLHILIFFPFNGIPEFLFRGQYGKSVDLRNVNFKGPGNCRKLQIRKSSLKFND